jgi:hypothetical protein
VQCAFEVHSTQVLLLVLQRISSPVVQCVLDVHSTHEYVSVRQCGSELTLQSTSPRQSTQLPPELQTLEPPQLAPASIIVAHWLLGLQYASRHCWVVLQSPASTQGTHCLVLVLQRGAPGLVQSPSPKHGTQVRVLVSQRGALGLVHCVSLRHCTHAPRSVHTPLPPASGVHAAPPVMVVVQSPVPTLHAFARHRGGVLAQSEASVHCTHTP